MTTKCWWDKMRLPWPSRIVAAAVMALPIVATASGQNQPSDPTTPVHPIPSAPKRSYTPASVGDPWVIGCDGSDIFNGSIFQLQGSTWVKQPGAANQIAVSPQGVPWVLSSNGSIFYWNGAGFSAAPAGCASSIAVGPVTAPLAGPYGDVWITGCGDVTNAGAKIFELQNGTSWVQIPGVASQISVSPDLGIPWVVNFSGQIFQ